MTHVWVIELKNERNGRYEPCASAFLDRQSARLELALWRKDLLPDDQLRIARYERHFREERGR